MTKSNSDRLTTGQLLTFASPAMPIAALALPIAVYLPPFYAEEFGISIAVIGGIMMLARIWDVITDPVLGVLSDRFTTRWGRRRIWIGVSLPFVLLGVFMIFLPPADADRSYLLGWMVFMYIGWTMLTISHMSWGAELSPDYDERSRIQGAREGALILGMFLVLLMPALVSWAAGESILRDQVAAMGLFVLIALPLTIGLAVWRVPERPARIAHHTKRKGALKRMLQNRPLRRILWVDILGGMSGTTVAVLFIWLAQDVLGLPKQREFLLLAYFLSGVLFVPLIIRVSYKLGKHRTLAYSVLLNAATLPLILAVPKGDVTFAIILWALFGINLGAGSFLIRAITADIVDVDEAESGGQNTGMFYALINMTSKVGAALATGGAYFLLEQVFGYTTDGNNDDYAIFGLKLIYIGLPIACNLVIAAILWNFPLDRTHQAALRSRIEENNAPKTG